MGSKIARITRSLAEVLLAASCSAVFIPCLWSAPLAAQDSKAIHLGLIGSLTGFAANYGNSVREGAELAADELKAEGSSIRISTEDDQSNSRETVTAYQKLKSEHHLDGIIGGSWWANSIVKLTERDHLPLMSAETLYNEEFIVASTHFSLAGDLRDWVSAFGPLVDKLQLKTASIVRFSSGFATTLAEEWAHLFAPPRKFLGALEYSDIQMSEAATLAAKVRIQRPDVVYVDAQPEGYATFLRRLGEQKSPDMVIFGHSSLDDAVRQGLIAPRSLPNSIYFSQRATASPTFITKFRKKYGRDPILEADLGYYAVHLLAQAAKRPDPIEALTTETFSINDIRFAFDEHHVYRGIKQEIWKVTPQGPERVELP